MFKKTNRLAKTTDVQRTTMRGRSFFNPNFVIKQGRPSGSEPKFAVIVATRVSKSAVKRNRIKRIIREALRSQISRVRPGDYAIIAKPPIAKMDDKALPAIIVKAFKDNRLL